MSQDNKLKLRTLDVGPIVGETTTNRVKIWGRAAGQIIENAPRRCFGVIRYRESKRNGAWSRPQYFKMNPNFDLTGVVVLDDLQPETRYEYELGYFFSDVELGDAPLRLADWSNTSKGYLMSAGKWSRVTSPIMKVPR